MEIRSGEYAELGLRHWGCDYPGDARRWEREEETRSRILLGPPEDRGVFLGLCVAPEMKAFAR